MSHITQGLSFNPLMMNNEVYGNLEQALFNDLNFSKTRKNKFSSSIDHYSSNCFIPPSCKMAPVTATSNLPSTSEIRSTDELQALSINHYLPFNKPQAHTSSFVPANQPMTYFGTDEVGFSNLFSLEHSFPDYRGPETVEEKKNDTLPYQLVLKQSMADPQELILQREFLSLPPYPPPDPSLPFNANEIDSFASSYLSLMEPICLTSDYKWNDCLTTPFNIAQNKNKKLKDETSFDPCSSTSSETNKSVKENSLPENKLISNPTKKPVSNITPKIYKTDYSSSDISCEYRSANFLKENVNVPKNIPNEDKKKEVVFKKEKLDFGTLDKKQSMQEFSNCPTNNIPKCDISLRNSKQSFNPATLSEYILPDRNLTLNPQDMKNSNISSVKVKKQEPFSRDSTISCQRTLNPEDPANKAIPELNTSSDILPVECDSTTETNLQAADLSSNSLHPNKIKADIPSSVGDESLSKTPTSNKCRICNEFLLTENPQQLTVPIDANFDVCSACNICFLQKSALSTNSSNDERPFKCSYCERDFKKVCYLILHLRIHSMEKPFKCSKCGKGFTNSNKLKLHSKTHSVYKAFSCGECGKRFVRNSHLKMHMKVHFGNRPFKCEICLKDFESRSKLSEHEKYHSPKLPFKCTTCEKSFVKKIYFESHLRIHCDAKPFECSMCKTCFAQKSVLRQHTKNCRFLVGTRT